MMKKIGALLAVTALALSGCAQTDREYPSKKIELIVAFGAGSTNDVVARAFAASFEDVSGGTVLVSNRPGAMGIIGTTEASLAADDGYTMLLAPVAAFTNAPLLQKTHYSSEDFKSVTSLSSQGFAITVRADSPYNSLDDLKNADSALTYATLGEGHSGHVLLAEILKDLGKDGRAIPFDGAANAIQSTISGETDIAVTDASAAYQREKSGEVKVLAVTGDERVPSMPDVPTVTEEGYPEANYLATQALAIPAGVDDETTQKITELAEKAVHSDSYQEYLKTANSTLQDIDGPKWMTDYVPEEKARIEQAYQELGIGQR